MCTVLRASTMFQRVGSFLDWMNLRASLAKVTGNRSMAEVQSIQIRPSAFTPATPAREPSGTMKLAIERSLEQAERRAVTGSSP